MTSVVQKQLPTKRLEERKIQKLIRGKQPYHIQLKPGTTLDQYPPELGRGLSPEAARKLMVEQNPHLFEEGVDPRERGVLDSHGELYYGYKTMFEIFNTDYVRDFQYDAASRLSERLIAGRTLVAVSVRKVAR